MESSTVYIELLGLCIESCVGCKDSTAYRLGSYAGLFINTAVVKAKTRDS